MNLASTSGVLGSAAGAPLSQSAGPEIERAARDAAARERLVDAQVQAESAAGIGQTREDDESSERDADGRRPWEVPGPRTSSAASTELAERKSKDPTGMSGNSLDLTG